MSKGVRPIVFEDAKNVASLLSSVSSQQEKDRNTSDDVFRARNWDEDDIIRTIQDGGQKFQIFVSTNEANEIIGVICCQILEYKNDDDSTDAKILYPNYICVFAPYWGQGYIKMLLECAIQYAKENSCSHIELEVCTSNKNAYDYFKFLGMSDRSYKMRYDLPAQKEEDQNTISNVRYAVIDDVPMIMPIIRASHKWHIDSKPNIILRAYSTDEIIGFIENCEKEVFVSTNEANEITGVLICQSYDKEELYINELAVAETYRGKGYGKMLFDYTKQWAKENGCTRIELYVYAFNKNAHDFYKSQGMNEMLCCMEYVLLQNPV